jgi:hypothetical protein
LGQNRIERLSQKRRVVVAQGDNSNERHFVNYKLFISLLDYCLCLSACYQVDNNAD